MANVITIRIKFNIYGNLRFLSHNETMRMFQRAFGRAGVMLVHSQGFNPRPKLSLGLPRSVGIEAENEFLYVKTENSCEVFDADDLKRKLSEQLPAGIEVICVEVPEVKKMARPRQATYILKIQSRHLTTKLRDGIKELLNSKTLNISRQIDAKGNTRIVDVRGFIEKIKIKGQTITIECGISEDGSIRPGEILELLKLSADKLSGPIRRTSVQWDAA